MADLSSPPHDRGHDRPQSVTCDTTILHQCGFEVQPLFRQISGPVGAGRRPRLPGASGLDRHFMAGAEPDRVCATVFLRRHARRGADPGAHSLCARTRKLPVVLSADEVMQFLEAVSSLKSRAALTTAYAAGLRASEVAGLRIEDIDSARGVIQVRHGKGAKDRNVMLSPSCLASCAPTGGSPGRGFICSLVVTKITRSTRPCCTPPAARR